MKKVMIVDDCEPDQFFTKIFIEKYNPNLEVLQAYDGKEALEILDALEVPPDLIFLDINMPVMNGHEFLHEYNKSHEQKTVIVMLTSSDQEADREKSRAFECVKRYFTKPVNEDDWASLSELGV